MNKEEVVIIRIESYFSVFMQIRCNFPDISYLSETQKNNFQFLSVSNIILALRWAIVAHWATCLMFPAKWITMLFIEHIKGP